VEAEARPLDLVLEEDLGGTEGTSAVDFFLPRTEALDSPGLEESEDLARVRPVDLPDLDAGLDAIEFSWKGLPVGPQGLTPRIGSRNGNIQPYKRVLQLWSAIVDLILSYLERKVKCSHVPQRHSDPSRTCFREQVAGATHDPVGTCTPGNTLPEIVKSIARR
jgi:hypothetical protein